MVQLLHEGPSHITADGTIGNPYILAAVVVISAAIVGITFWSAVQPRGVRLIFLVLASLACVRSDLLYYWFAFELNGLISGHRTPTTFFGSPSAWVAPASLVAGVVAARLTVRWRNRHRPAGDLSP